MWKNKSCHVRRTLGGHREVPVSLAALARDLAVLRLALVAQNSPLWRCGGR
jgi:hypothetical protein